MSASMCLNCSALFIKGMQASRVWKRRRGKLDRGETEADGILSTLRHCSCTSGFMSAPGSSPADICVQGSVMWEGRRRSSLILAKSRGGVKPAMKCRRRETEEGERGVPAHGKRRAVGTNEQREGE